MKFSAQTIKTVRDRCSTMGDRFLTGHIRQIRKALRFIEDHLSDDLNPGVIARDAGMSPWHFQRIFSATLRQPLMDYVRRRRLSVAVDALRSSLREILDIALDSGFESQEALTRAFKAMFGVTPGVCRKDGARVLMLQAIPDITAEYIKHLYQGITMTPTIQILPSRFVVGLERPFISVLSPQRNNHIVIPQLWQDFCGRMGEIKDAKGDANLGCVFCDDGETGMCRYLACSEVPSLADVPEGMTGYKIPEGRYAVFIHKGVIGRIGETMNYIYGSWFPQSGQRYRNGPEIEIYGEKFDPESEQSEMEICIPIE